MNKSTITFDNLATNLDLFNDLMDNELFFEAHEIMENVWIFFKENNHPFEKLSKGLTNAAISLEHIKRNTKGAKRKALITMGAFDRFKNNLDMQVEFYDYFSSSTRLVENFKKRYKYIFNS